MPGGGYVQYLSTRAIVDPGALSFALSQPDGYDYTRLYIPVGGLDAAASYLERFVGEEREGLAPVLIGHGGAAVEVPLLEQLAETTQLPVPLPEGLTSPRAVAVGGRQWLLPRALRAAQESLRVLATGGYGGSPHRLDDWLASVGVVPVRLGVRWFGSGSARWWSSSVAYAAGLYVARYGLPSGINVDGVLNSAMPLPWSRLTDLIGARPATVRIEALLAAVAAVSGAGALVRVGSQYVGVLFNDGTPGSLMRWWRPKRDGGLAEVQVHTRQQRAALVDSLGDHQLEALVVNAAGRASTVHDLLVAAEGTQQRPAARLGITAPRPVAAAGLPSGSSSSAPVVGPEWNIHDQFPTAGGTWDYDSELLRPAHDIEQLNTDLTRSREKFHRDLRDFVRRSMTLMDRIQDPARRARLRTRVAIANRLIRLEGYRNRDRVWSGQRRVHESWMFADEAGAVDYERLMAAELADRRFIAADLRLQAMKNRGLGDTKGSAVLDAMATNIESLTHQEDHLQQVHLALIQFHGRIVERLLRFGRGNQARDLAANGGLSIEIASAVTTLFKKVTAGLAWTPESWSLRLAIEAEIGRAFEAGNCAVLAGLLLNQLNQHARGSMLTVFSVRGRDHALLVMGQPGYREAAVGDLLPTEWEPVIQALYGIYRLEQHDILFQQRADGTERQQLAIDHLREFGELTFTNPSTGQMIRAAGLDEAVAALPRQLYPAMAELEVPAWLRANHPSWLRVVCNIRTTTPRINTIDGAVPPPGHYPMSFDALGATAASNFQINPESRPSPVGQLIAYPNSVDLYIDGNNNMWQWTEAGWDPDLPTYRGGSAGLLSGAPVLRPVPPPSVPVDAAADVAPDPVAAGLPSGSSSMASGVGPEWNVHDLFPRADGSDNDYNSPLPPNVVERLNDNLAKTRQQFHEDLSVFAEQLRNSTGDAEELDRLRTGVEAVNRLVSLERFRTRELAWNEDLWAYESWMPSDPDGAGEYERLLASEVTDRQAVAAEMRRQAAANPGIRAQAAARQLDAMADNVESLTHQEDELRQVHLDLIHHYGRFVERLLRFGRGNQARDVAATGGLATALAMAAEEIFGGAIADLAGASDKFPLCLAIAAEIGRQIGEGSCAVLAMLLLMELNRQSPGSVLTYFAAAGVDHALVALGQPGYREATAGDVWPPDWSPVAEAEYGLAPLARHSVVFRRRADGTDNLRQQAIDHLSGVKRITFTHPVTRKPITVAGFRAAVEALPTQPGPPMSELDVGAWLRREKRNWTVNNIRTTTSWINSTGAVPPPGQYPMYRDAFRATAANNFHANANIFVRPKGQLTARAGSADLYDDETGNTWRWTASGWRDPYAPPPPPVVGFSGAGSAGLLSGAPVLGPTPVGLSTLGSVDAYPKAPGVAGRVLPRIVPPAGARYQRGVVVVGSARGIGSVLEAARATGGRLARAVVVLNLAAHDANDGIRVLTDVVERFGWVGQPRPVVLALSDGGMGAQLGGLDVALVRHAPTAAGAVWQVPGSVGPQRVFQELADGVFQAAIEVADRRGGPVPPPIPGALAQWLQATSWARVQQIFQEYEPQLAHAATQTVLARVVADRPADTWRAALHTIVDLQLRAAGTPRAGRSPVAPVAIEVWGEEPIPEGPLDAAFALDYLTPKGTRRARLLWDGLLLAAWLGGKVLTTELVSLARAVDTSPEQVANAQVFAAVSMVSDRGRAAFAAASELVSWDNCKLHPDAKLAWFIRIDRIRAWRGQRGLTENNALLERLADIIADCL